MEFQPIESNEEVTFVIVVVAAVFVAGVLKKWTVPRYQIKMSAIQVIS